MEFELSIEDNSPLGVRMGCGVTAYDLYDAIGLVKSHIFHSEECPLTKKIIQDVDIATLDTNHVVPNMGSVLKRGIWFPLGYG